MQRSEPYFRRLTRGHWRAIQTTTMPALAAAAEEASHDRLDKTWAAGCCDLLDVAVDWTADETPWNSRRLDTDTAAHL